MPNDASAYGDTRSSSGRPVTDVAVGILIRPDGYVLMGDRPSGKPYAGFWEFPGGKLEPGETVAQAMSRELEEELGVVIGAVHPWLMREFDYPHAYVRLHFCKVFDWQGEAVGREGQRTAFIAPPLLRPAQDQPLSGIPGELLPAAVEMYRWLALPPSALLLDLDQAVGCSAQLCTAVREGRRLIVLQSDNSVERDRDQKDLRRELVAALSIAGALVLKCGMIRGSDEGWAGYVVRAGEQLSSDTSVSKGAWRGLDLRPTAVARIDQTWLAGTDFVMLDAAGTYAEDVRAVPRYRASSEHLAGLPMAVCLNAL
jgi:8-oxo-dGTP diphosphatase